MSAVAAASASGQYLWFVSRASGVLLLVLLSIVMLLGAATRLGSSPAWLSRFAVADLHRNLSLFAVALLVLHAVTALLDPYVTIGWAAAIVPLASPYRTLAIGLGTAAVDLGGAVLLTSLLRRRLGYRAWRAVHWLAYLAWPAAFAHSVTAGGDLGVWWVAAAEYASVTMIAAALIARLLARARAGPGRTAGAWPAPGR